MKRSRSVTRNRFATRKARTRNSRRNIRLSTLRRSSPAASRRWRRLCPRRPRRSALPATMREMVQNGAISGAALSGADAAVRGHDVAPAAGVGGIIGGAAGPVGKGVGKVVSAIADRVRPSPAVAQNVAKVGDVEIPLSQSQVTQNPALSAEEQILLRGGRGDAAQAEAQGFKDLQDARMGQARDNFGGLAGSDRRHGSNRAAGRGGKGRGGIDRAGTGAASLGDRRSCGPDVAATARRGFGPIARRRAGSRGNSGRCGGSAFGSLCGGPQCGARGLPRKVCCRFGSSWRVRAGLCGRVSRRCRNRLAERRKPGVAGSDQHAQISPRAANH